MTVQVITVTNEEQYRQSLAIRTEVFVVEQKVSFELEVDEYEEICEHFLCLKDDEPVATGRMRKKEWLVKFERIATIKKHRGNNYGVVLMLAMQEHAVRKFPDLLPYMHAQRSAAGFYDKLGWIRIGEEFFEADIEHVAMVLLPAGILGTKLHNSLLAMKDLPAPLRAYLG